MGQAGCDSTTPRITGVTVCQLADCHSMGRSDSPPPAREHPSPPLSPNWGRPLTPPARGAQVAAVPRRVVAVRLTTTRSSARSATEIPDPACSP
jgi:hypothetical protein